MKDDAYYAQILEQNSEPMQSRKAILNSHMAINNRLEYAYYEPG